MQEARVCGGDGATPVPASPGLFTRSTAVGQAAPGQFAAGQAAPRPAGRRA